MNNHDDGALGVVARELAAREPIFHRPEFGTTRADFDRMMASDFWEVGASGKKYSREFVLDALEQRHKNPEPEYFAISDFACRAISDDTYLVTYQLEQDGGRFSRRSTLWRNAPEGWQIIYHQGTKIERTTLDARTFSIELFDRWTQLWNLKLHLAPDLLAPDLELHYAQSGSELFDTVKTPEQLVDAIRHWHSLRPGIQFEVEGEPCVDAVQTGDSYSGMIARPYNVCITNADNGDVWRSGTDILKFRDGLICEVWSVSSGREGRTFRKGLAFNAGA